MFVIKNKRGGTVHWNVLGNYQAVLVGTWDCVPCFDTWGYSYFIFSPVSMTKSTTKLCPKCKEEVKSWAKKCKHCWADLRSRFRKHPIRTFILIVTIIGGIISATTSPYDYSSYDVNDWNNTQNKPKVWKFERNPMEMCIYAQQWVEENIKPTLKNPWSLSLPTCSNEIENDTQFVIKAPDWGFMYQSHYLSENDFWATVTRDFWCAVRYWNYPNYTLNCAVIE